MMNSKRIFPRLLSVLAVISLATAGIYFASRSRGWFPVLPPGSYAGEFDGATAGIPGEKARWFIEKREDGELLAAILLPGWAPVFIPGQNNEEAFELTNGEYSISFSGRKNGAGDYHGDVVNTYTGQSGAWALWPVKPTAVNSEEERARIRLWLALSAEKQTVEKRTEEAARLIPQKEKEIAALSRLVSEGRELEHRARLKLEEEQKNLASVSAEYQARLQESRQLDAGYQVSQRVTGRGKLVSLSRESLAREWRWVEAAAAAEKREQKAAADEHLKQEAELKAAIEEEKERIHGLLSERVMYDESADYEVRETPQ